MPVRSRGDGLAAVVPQGAESVHLLGIAVPQDAALPHGEGGIIADGPVDGIAQVLQHVHPGDLPQLLALEGLQSLLQPGQHRRAVAELSQVPAAGAAVDTAVHQALDIVDLPQGEHQLAAAHRLLGQLPHRGVAPLDGEDRQQRPLHPGAQEPCPHGGLGLVQHPEEAAPLFSAAQRLGELQTAPGGPVHLHIASAVEHVQPPDIAQVKFLGLPDVAEQGAGGTDGLALPLQPGLVHVGKAKLLAQGGRGGHELEILPGRLQHGVQLLAQKFPDGPGVQGGAAQQRLPGGKAAQLVEDVAQAVFLKGGAAEFAGGHVAEGDAAPVAAELHGADIIAPLFLQHGALGDGAGGDDADHIPLHQALGQGGILHLLADGNLIALGDEPGDIGLGAVIGHAAHGRAQLRVLHVPVPGGECQVQLPGGHLGVVIEHLVKIAQPEKQQAIRVLLLDLVILLLHGRQFSHDNSPFLVSLLFYDSDAGECFRRPLKNSVLLRCWDIAAPEFPGK